MLVIALKLRRGWTDVTRSNKMKRELQPSQATFKAGLVLKVHYKHSSVFALKLQFNAFLIQRAEKKQTT